MSVVDDVYDYVIAKYPILEDTYIHENWHTSMYSFESMNCYVQSEEALWESLHCWDSGFGVHPIRKVVEYATQGVAHPAEYLAFAVAHELGHAYFHQIGGIYMDEGKRTVVGAMHTSMASLKLYRLLPSERDADLFAMCILRGMRNRKSDDCQAALETFHKQWKKDVRGL